MWTYRAKVIRVVDGDTVDVDIDLGFGIWQKNERVRIMGIDTPESRTRDKVEKKFGLASKAMLKRVLGKETILKTTINKKMVDEHYAVLYNGQSKDAIEKQHLKNRKRLLEAGKI